MTESIVGCPPYCGIPPDLRRYWLELDRIGETCGWNEDRELPFIVQQKRTVIFEKGSPENGVSNLLETFTKEVNELRVVRVKFEGKLFASDPPLPLGRLQFGAVVAFTI